MQKRGAFRNLARACDPYNSSRKGVLGRIGWTNCLANLANRSSRSGLLMNSRLGEQLEVGKDADTEQLKNYPSLQDCQSIRFEPKQTLPMESLFLCEHLCP
nr:hypothetical protein [Bidens alba var. radiata]